MYAIRSYYVPAPEQPGKQLLKLDVDQIEGFTEALAGGAIDFADRGLQTLQRLLQVPLLRD